MITGNYKIHIVLPDGTIKDWNSFDKIEKKQIAESVTNQAMAMLGYEPKEEKAIDNSLEIAG